MDEENLYDPGKMDRPIYKLRNPGIEDSIAFEITFQRNPFWVNDLPPRSVWAWWEGRYRLLDLDT